VLSEDYATKITRDWNVKHSGSGYVTRFHVRQSFLDSYEIDQVGGRTILEYRIAAEDVAELNANIVGLIELVADRLTRNIRNPGKPEFGLGLRQPLPQGLKLPYGHDALEADVHLAVDLARVGHVLHDGEPPERVLDCLRDRLGGCGPSLPAGVFSCCFLRRAGSSCTRKWPCAKRPSAPDGRGTLSCSPTSSSCGAAPVSPSRYAPLQSQTASCRPCGTVRGTTRRIIPAQ